MSNDVITVGSATSTGGKVVSGNSGMVINNKPIALVGDMATCACPNILVCRRQGVIVAMSPRNANVNGVLFARAGDLVDTGCGGCFLLPSEHGVSLGTDVGCSLNVGSGISFGNGVNINQASVAPRTEMFSLSDNNIESVQNTQKITQDIVGGTYTEALHIIDAFVPSVENVLAKYIKDGVYVWVETIGVGHSFISIIENKIPTLYSYGRYGNDGISDGVLLIYKGDEAYSYMRDQLFYKSATVFHVAKININNVRHYFEVKYKIGNSIVNTYTSNADVENRIKQNGKVIDTYELTSNNCTTHSVSSLLLGGLSLENNVVPSSFKDYLNDSESVTDVTIVFNFYYSKLYKKKVSSETVKDLFTSFVVGSSGDEVISISNWIN